MSRSARRRRLAATTPTKSRTGLPKPSCCSTASAALVAWFTSISGDSSRRRKSALASISAAERVHLGHHGIERVLILGVRVERGGVAVGEAAAGGDRRSTRGHDAVPCAEAAPGRGREWETGRPDRRAASSMGSGGEQHASRRGRRGRESRAVCTGRPTGLTWHRWIRFPPP